MPNTQQYDAMPMCKSQCTKYSSCSCWVGIDYWYFVPMRCVAIASLSS